MEKIMNYNKARKDIDNLLGKEPKQIVKYFAYGDGKVMGEYDTCHDADLVSDLVDSVVVNKEEIKTWRAKRDGAYDNLITTFLKELRESYPDISDAMYNLIYDNAYDRGHSAGFDEVALYVQDYYAFMCDILAIELNGHTND
jgi:hypothetical protein